jgi:glycerophosphoryl diester phosphodiesterase
VSPVAPCSRPLVFAHRGGRALAPENTLAAFDLGLRSGADGLELDVRLSCDGVPVVVHDADLDRCTDATGPVAARTAAELARVDAGYRFGDGVGFPWRARGLGIPTLAEVLARYTDVPIIVEIKEATSRIASAVVDVVRASGAVSRVCVGSFSLVPLSWVRRLEPALATGASRQEGQRALYRTWCGLGLGRVAYRAFQLPVWSGRLQVVSPGLIHRAKRARVAFQVWTINQERDMWSLLDWGVDGLISDRPEVAVAVRDEWARRRID